MTNGKVEDDKNISMTNVKIFTDSLKDAKITHFDYSGWEGKFDQALAGVDTQANTVMFNRNKLKMEIKQLMEEAESNAMSETDPGYNIALKLNNIMPLFGEELELRAVERELQNLMLATASNIINTMKGMGIAENVVEKQQEFLNEHWERLEKLFTENIQKLVDNNKIQIDVALKHSEDINKRLIEQIEKREKFIEDMVKTKIYEPSYHLSPPMQKVIDKAEIEKPVEEPVDDTAKIENEKLLKKLNNAHAELEKLKKEKETKPVEAEKPEQKQIDDLAKIKEAVISTGQQGKPVTDKKEENDMNGTKLTGKDREKMSEPFSNVDSDSEINASSSAQNEAIQKKLKEAELAFKEVTTARGLKISYASKCKNTPDGDPRAMLDKIYNQRMTELEQVEALATRIDNNIPPE